MPVLDSISIDLTNWQLRHRDEQMAVWSDEEGDALGVNLFLEKPDIPPPSDGVVGLRSYFRQQCQASSGIVEVDVVPIHGVACGRMIVKARQQPTGFTFRGTCVIPKRDFSFVFRVQCVERGTTGARESVVMLTELPNPEYEPDPIQEPHPLFPNAIPRGRIKGWFKDPYDSTFDSTALRTLADDEKYDDKFPNHPLSRARRKLRLMIDSLVFDKEVLDALNHVA